MSLTAGTGPFGENPAGEFNFTPDPPGAAIYWDPVPQRVRVFVGDEAVADSRRAHLLHETGHLPVYYFPPEDVRTDYLSHSEKRTHCPVKGDATHHSLRVGARLVPDAVWEYREPLPSVPFIAGWLAFYWERVDRWLVEEEEAHGHPRDPYHRIDVYPTRQRVRVSLDGEQLAESTRAKLLVETALPPRYYLPHGDIHMNLLDPSDTRTRCAYKGLASYFKVDGRDVAWTYPEPEYDGERVRGLIAFDGDLVQIDVEELREDEHPHGPHGLVERIVAEEHHLQEVAKVGYEPATLPILLMVIVGALAVIVGIALGVSIAVYYLS
jgi:uncharacterized protein (DUF427 family)